MRPERTKRAIQAVRVVRARLRTTLRTPKAPSGESSERDASEVGSASSSDMGQSSAKQKTKGRKAKAQSQADGSGEATNENVRAIQSVLDAMEEAINDAMKGADASKALASDLSEEAQKPGNPNRLQTNVAPTRFLDVAHEAGS